MVADVVVRTPISEALPADRRRGSAARRDPAPADLAGQTGQAARRRLRRGLRANHQMLNTTPRCRVLRPQAWQVFSARRSWPRRTAKAALPNKVPPGSTEGLDHQLDAHALTLTSPEARRPFGLPSLANPIFSKKAIARVFSAIVWRWHPGTVAGEACRATGRRGRRRRHASPAHRQQVDVQMRRPSLVVVGGGGSRVLDRVPRSRL